MKPFRINRNSWHYKLNKHFMNEDSYSMDRWERHRNNFCSYWRATFFRVVAILVITSAVTFILASIAYAIWANPMGSAIAIGMIVAVIATIVGVLFIAYTVANKAEQINNDPNPSIVIQRYKMYKSKICPSVQYDK